MTDFSLSLTSSRLVDMGRTVVNVAGNVTATLIIGKSENEFDQEKHDKYVASFK